MRGRVVKIKNTWYDRLINYIPELIRNHVRVLKDKTISIKLHLNKLLGEERYIHLKKLIM